ncbi:hypothetical protein KP509_1Z152900 [Ceratopteris richardii]|nr:hypothetical protein KP509_1Z152900 [Ceratopteris richardii]
MNQTADSTADIAVPCSHLQGLTLERDVEAFESSKLGKIVVDDMHTETQHSIGERVGKRKKKQLRKLQRLKDGKGAVTTIGEFDFLFEETFKKDPETYAQSEAEMFGSSQTSGEIRINHWEASVKFLLYAGPWEMFGVKTPSHAAWHHLCAENENERHNSQGHVGFLCKETAVRLDECQLKEIKQCEDKFLGSFLGPHVGETLYNRKTRLINQLSLSQNIHAAALLCHHFGSCNPTESSLCTGDNCHLSKALLNTFDNYTSLINHKHHKVLRVFPRAILKGYLFYEHELWAQIYQKSRSGQGVNNYPETTNSSAQSNAGVNYDTSIINPGHWMGWWIQASNFPIFAMSTAHKQSKWYIVPKLEWLPPVVIDAADEIRTHQVLSLNEFMIVAEKIAKEAEQTKISRKQRFMVAEMAWETVNEMDPACDSKRFGSNLDGLSEEFGRWTEISRGFVVEDSWPDTRMYSPHGYKLFSVP